MDTRVYHCEQVEDLKNLSIDILTDFQGSKIFTFHGQLGVGKTALIKNLCQELGYYDPVTSPTFSLINEYSGTFGKIYHMDLYRLRNLDEAFEIGLEEYLHSGHYCFIEWPTLAESLLDAYNRVTIEVDIYLNRKIELHFIN